MASIRDMSREISHQASSDGAVHVIGTSSTTSTVEARPGENLFERALRPRAGTAPERRGRGAP